MSVTDTKDHGVSIIQQLRRMVRESDIEDRYELAAHIVAQLPDNIIRIALQAVIASWIRVERSLHRAIREPSWEPGRTAPAIPVAKSGQCRREAATAAYHRAFLRAMLGGAKGHKRLADFNEEDLLAVIGARYKQSAELTQRAKEFERILAMVREEEVPTVGDLSEEALDEIGQMWIR